MWEPRGSAKPRAQLQAAAGPPTSSRAPHILASPPGTPAPVGAINYTPKTNQIHPPGQLAPVDQLNYSLLPHNALGMGNEMGAGAEPMIGGSPPVSPGQERLTGRYRPPPTMATGMFQPGAPPTTTSPFGTGPGPRSAPSGPMQANFGTRGSMLGNTRNWGGAGQEVQDTDPDATLSGLPNARSSSGGGGSSAAAADTSGDQQAAPVASTSTADAAVLAISDATVDNAASAPPSGWHSEGSPDGSKTRSGGPSQLWWVSNDGKKRLYKGSFQPTVPGSPDRFIAATKSDQQQLSSGIDFSTAAKNTTTTQTLVGDDGKPHKVRITFDPSGKEVGRTDLGPTTGGTTTTPKNTTTTQTIIGDDGQPHRVQVTTDPNGKEISRNDLGVTTGGTSSQNSVAVEQARAAASLSMDKPYTTFVGKDGATYAFDQESGDSFPLTAADPLQGIFTSGDSLVQVDPDTMDAKVVYKAPPNYSLTTANGRTILYDPKNPSDTHTLAEDSTWAPRQAVSLDQARATLAKTQQDLVTGDISNEDALAKLAVTAHDLTHPKPYALAGDIITPEGAELDIDYGDFPGASAGMKGVKHVSGGPLDPQTQKVAQQINDYLDRLSGTVGHPAVGQAPGAPTTAAATGATPAAATAGYAPTTAAPTSQTNVGQPLLAPGMAGTENDPRFKDALPPMVVMDEGGRLNQVGGSLEAGLAGIPGRDPRLSGKAQPPTKITSASGDVSVSGPGDTLSVGLTPSDEQDSGDTSDTSEYGVDDLGTGQDTFMGRGLTPQQGRGSTGIGWQPRVPGWGTGAGHVGGSGMSGGGGAGQDGASHVNDPLFHFAMARRRGQGAGQDAGPPPPSTPGAAVPQPPGASPPPGASSPPAGWTPPLPPQDVAGIGHRFGQQMDQGEPQHSGVDLQAPEGTPTVSPVDGMVERVEHNPEGLGLTVIIRGKDGTEHRLGHLSHTDAYPGMLVGQGQDLQSKVGSSGNTTGAHLHWGVRDGQGQPQDPTATLGPMANMPPVPGTQQMGPPGGTPGPGMPPPGPGGPPAGPQPGPPPGPPPPMQGAGQEADPNRPGWSLPEIFGKNWGDFGLREAGGVKRPAAATGPGDLQRLGPVSINPMEAFGSGQDDTGQDAGSTADDAAARAASGLGPGGLSPLPRNVSPWNDVINKYAGDYANDPRFMRTVAAAARAESGDDPQRYQIGYKADDPKTWQKFGGRGLWQFDVGPQGMGHGIPEDQLFNPDYQASRIVPEFAKAYGRMKDKPGLSDEALAAQVYGATERPAGTVGGQWQSPREKAYQNYTRAYNDLGTGQDSQPTPTPRSIPSQYGNIPLGPPPEHGWNQQPSLEWLGGARDWVTERLKQAGIGTGHDMGSGQNSGSPDYQAGYQAGLQASKSPGMPPVFVPAMAQPIPSVGDSGGNGGGGGDGSQQPGAGQDSVDTRWDLYQAKDTSGFWGPQGQPQIGAGGEGGMGAGATASVPASTAADIAARNHAAELQHQAAMAQIQQQIDAENNRHQEVEQKIQQDAAFHQDDVRLKAEEDAEANRHNQATEQLQQQQTQMQQSLEQMREANAIQTQQMQEGAAIYQQQGDQAFKDWQATQNDRMGILSSALNNPWLQKLTGMTPAPGVTGGVTGGQNLSNLIQQILQPFDVGRWGVSNAPASANVLNPQQPFTPPAMQPIQTQAQAPDNLSWDQLSEMIRSATGGKYDGENIKEMAFKWAGQGERGDVPMHLSQEQINYLVQQGSGGQFQSFGQMLGGPQTVTQGGVTGQTPGAAGATTGQQAAAAPAQSAAGQQPLDPTATMGMQQAPSMFTDGAAQLSTPSWSQWQGWNPFQMAAYRTNIEALGPGVWNQMQQGLQSDWASAGGTPDITAMQAAGATPEQSIGQQMTAEVFGQTAPQWQQQQQKQWSQAKAPQVKQNLSGIAA